MRSIDFTDSAPVSPQQILRRMSDPQAWDSDSTTISGSVETGLDITSSTPLIAADVPAAFASMLPDSAAVEQRLRTSGESDSPMTIDVVATIPGAPVTVTAQLSFADSGAGSAITVHGEVSSNAPLFGGMIESAIVGKVEGLLRERIDQLVEL